MAEQEEADDLDAFFAAAESGDSEAIRQAAQQVASTSERADKRFAAADKLRNSSRPGARVRQGGKAKYIAIEEEDAASGDPFTVVPHSFPAHLPWWGWASIGVVLAGIFFAVLFMPALELANLTARLGDSGPSSQAAMRQLVLRGDERTINILFEMANSQKHDINKRLQAVDTLSLIREPAAERALLRLELAASTDLRVREHAKAARQQRESAAASRPR